MGTHPLFFWAIHSAGTAHCTTSTPLLWHWQPPPIQPAGFVANLRNGLNTVMHNRLLLAESGH